MEQRHVHPRMERPRSLPRRRLKRRPRARMTGRHPRQRKLLVLVRESSRRKRRMKIPCRLISQRNPRLNLAQRRRNKRKHRTPRLLNPRSGQARPQRRAKGTKLLKPRERRKKRGKRKKRCIDGGTRKTLTVMVPLSGRLSSTTALYFLPLMNLYLHM